MKKSKALELHNKWLEKIGVSMSKSVKRSPYKLPNLREDLRKMPPTSDTVGNGYSKRSNVYSGSSTIITGQGYNKGNYVVLSKEEAKDPATGKRRS